MSIKAIRGDISPAAHDALMASAPRRMPRFFVFHCRCFENVCVDCDDDVDDDADVVLEMGESGERRGG